MQSGALLRLYCCLLGCWDACAEPTYVLASASPNSCNVQIGADSCMTMPAWACVPCRLAGQVTSTACRCWPRQPWLLLAAGLTQMLSLRACLTGQATPSLCVIHSASTTVIWQLLPSSRCCHRCAHAFVCEGQAENYVSSSRAALKLSMQNLWNSQAALQSAA